MCLLLDLWCAPTTAVERALPEGVYTSQASRGGLASRPVHNESLQENSPLVTWGGEGGQ